MSANFIEIERKFLVWPVPHEKLADFPRRSYRQAYVVTGDTEVRIRCDVNGRGAESYRLAIKRGLGYVRDEVEVPVTQDEGEKLFDMAGPRVLTKTRYELPNDYVLDELHGALGGMWILERETDSEGEPLPDAPAFLRIMFEVTHNPAFKTQRLALGPAWNKVLSD
jgi:CYTH domain-containing protein